ncbi:hypothetical protein [Rhodanobacter thiooxydans]|nr:hypothetical protein [Rhodanobacter thiooxydans]UJJ53404.1 hypothetical protein LRK53_10385 [Rhodanobacter thiooxydans]
MKRLSRGIGKSGVAMGEPFTAQDRQSYAVTQCTADQFGPTYVVLRVVEKCSGCTNRRMAVCKRTA